MVVVLIPEYGPQTGEDPPCPQLTRTLYMKSLLEAFEVRFSSTLSPFLIAPTESKSEQEYRERACGLLMPLAWS